MTPRYHLFLAVALLLVGALSLSGCSAAVAGLAVGAKLAAPDTVTHKAEYKIGGQSIVVIPFKDQRHPYYESRDGVDLATAVVGELIKRKVASNIKSDEQVQTLFEGQDLGGVGWAKIGKQLGVQLILSGDIERFTLKDPMTFMVLRGTCRVNYFVYDVEKDAFAYAMHGLEVYVPDHGVGIAESDIDPERLRAQLLATTALKVVQKFYTYKEKIRPPPQRF